MDAEKIQRGIAKGPAAGVTLLELTVVLAVALALTMGVVWSVRASDRRELENASKKLQSDFRYAQRMAMIEGRIWGIQIFADSYRIYTAGDGISDTVKIENGVKIAVYGQTNVLYYPRGSLGGNGFTLTLYNDSFTQQMTGLPSSGRIKVDKPVPKN